MIVQVCLDLISISELYVLHTICLWSACCFEHENYLLRKTQYIRKKVRYFEAIRARHMEGQKGGSPDDWALPEFRYIDLDAGRKCARWFTEAGLTDITPELKVENWVHRGVEKMEPRGMDIVPMVDWDCGELLD
jgi:hypothetical protein